MRGAEQKDRRLLERIIAARTGVESSYATTLLTMKSQKFSKSTQPVHDNLWEQTLESER